MNNLESKSPSASAFALLLIGAAIIAFAPIFVRVSEVGPIMTAFWRVVLAVPMLGVLMVSTGKSTPAAPLGRKEFVRLALAGFFFAGDLAVWHFSIHYTSVANATLLPNLAPVFVTLFGFVLFKEKVTRLFIVAMAVAISGAVILMGDSLSLSSQNFVGDLLGMLTALFYASYILAIGRLRARLGTIVVMFWSTVFMALFLAPAALVSGEALLPASIDGWVTLFGVALTAQVIGQGLIAYALAHLPVSFSSVSLLFQPVVATVAAWAIFGEALGPLQGLGALVVLVGVALARRGSAVK